MNIAELKPLSANWNQIKAEFQRNIKVFEILKKHGSKDGIAAMKKLIETNEESIKIMDNAEQKPDAFQSRI